MYHFTVWGVVDNVIQTTFGVGLAGIVALEGRVRYFEYV